MKYRVLIPGYPCHETLLSTGGKHLKGKKEFHFTTVRTGEGKSCFLDLTPDTGPRLLSVNGTSLGLIDFPGLRLPADGVLELEFSEPIHPDSVFENELELHIAEPGIEPPSGKRTVFFHAHIMDNSNRYRIRLSPLSRLVPGRKYDLRYESLGFTDFTGNKLQEVFGHITVYL